jgi:Tol biopolymer transport system component
VASLTPGTRIGAYEIVASLGAGGMGEVFRARDHRLGREVALKILPETIGSDAERRARFEREARSLAALNHPSIVTIFAVEEADGRQYIAMECVDGRMLSDVIPKGGLALERLLNIAIQVAGAVAAAHRQGIVHRDLKPANVMVGAHDRVKVLDFGLAKLRDEGSGDAQTLLPTPELTGEGRIVGTVAYMSPEQAEGRKVDERSDVFSLGVLLYEMATSERPFKGETSLSVLSAILRDTPRPLADVNPSVPRDLARIVRRCLAKDPDDRYQSAADLRNDVEDLRQSVLSGQVDRPMTVGARPRSRRLALVLAGLAVAGVAGLAWAARFIPGRSAPPLPSLTFSRLTLLEGVTTDPMISPDGKWVVYVSAVSGNPDIYLQSTTGQTAINLTKDSPDNDVMPAFSPDGERIAFRSARDGGGIFVMGRMGESVRRLTRRGFQPAWFPDGRTIVFASIAVPNAESRGGDVSELWVVDAAGGEPRLLWKGDAVQPRVSPRGLRIAYWGLPTESDPPRITAGNRDIWTVGVDGSKPVRVTSHDAVESNPVWSPDGRWLYFISDRSGTTNLWRIGIDEASGVTTGDPQALTVPASYIWRFSLSSDGRLATYATRAGSRYVARIHFDPVTATTRGAIETLAGPRDFGSLDVSRDGRELVLTSAAPTQEDLYILPTDGGGLRQLTNDGFRDRAANWSADGRTILFYSDRGNGYEAWAIDRDGSSLRALTQTGGRRQFPVSSRDGLKLAVADITAWELFVYDPRDMSAPPGQLPPVPSELRVASGNLVPSDWSPDGRVLLGAVTAGGAMWTYSLDTQKYSRIAGGGAARWLGDGRRILHVRQGRLFVTDSVTAESRELLSVPGETLTSPRIDPGGNYLYFVRVADDRGDVWVARFDDSERPATQTP